MRVCEVVVRTEVILCTRSTARWNEDRRRIQFIFLKSGFSAQLPSLLLCCRTRRLTAVSLNGVSERTHVRVRCRPRSASRGSRDSVAVIARTSLRRRHRCRTHGTETDLEVLDRQSSVTARTPTARGRRRAFSSRPRTRCATATSTRCATASFRETAPSRRRTAAWQWSPHVASASRCSAPCSRRERLVACIHLHLQRTLLPCWCLCRAAMSVGVGNAAGCMLYGWW